MWIPVFWAWGTAVKAVRLAHLQKWKKVIPPKSPPPPPPKKRVGGMGVSQQKPAPEGSGKISCGNNLPMKVSEKILQLNPAPTPLNVRRKKTCSNSLVAGNFVGDGHFCEGIIYFEVWTEELKENVETGLAWSFEWGGVGWGAAGPLNINRGIYIIKDVLKQRWCLMVVVIGEMHIGPNFRVWLCTHQFFMDSKQSYLILAVSCKRNLRILFWSFCAVGAHEYWFSNPRL